MDIKKIASIAKFKIKKYSPEILVGVGTVAIVGGVVLACKATLNLDDILTNAEKRKEEINTDTIVEDERAVTVANAKNVVKTGVDILTNYAPSACLVGSGIVCMYAAYGIVKKRNVALTAAYEALDYAYKNYRKAVREEVGEDREWELAHGITKKTETVEETGEDGKKKKVKKDIYSVNDLNVSPYAKFFDDMSSCYKNDPEYNMIFLKAQQNYANDLFKTRGHLFLNEVYDMLDIPRTQAGQMVGWIKGAGDDYIDFGLYDNRERVRAFVNGVEPAILLDFNVDGVIYDKI